MRSNHFQFTEAAKLELLAELAAAKGQPELAEDIRRASRLLVRAAPPHVTEAGAFFDRDPRPGRSNSPT